MWINSFQETYLYNILSSRPLNFIIMYRIKQNMRSIRRLMTGILSSTNKTVYINYTTTTHTCLTALCPGLSRWAGTWKVKPIWILLEKETVSGSGISWAICKSAPRSRQITVPVPHHSVFYRPDTLPATQPTASKHWRQFEWNEIKLKKLYNKHENNFAC